MNPRNILYPILSLVVFAAMVLNSCRKPCTDPTNPNCENYDPCYNLKPTSAGFKTYLPIPDFVGFWKTAGWVYDVESDTIGVECYFRAEEENAKYTWLIGGGVYHTRTVSIDFRTSNLAPGTRVPVTLIVEKEPNKKCFPNDNGKDTFIKEILVARNEINKYLPMYPETENINDTNFMVFESTDLKDPSKKWQFRYGRHYDTDLRNSIFYWDNIPNGISSNLPDSRVLLGPGGIKTSAGIFNGPQNAYIVGLYYIDGKHYDFRLKEIDGTTRDTLSDRRFRAVRIK
jgi:hypothetical protein